jgi:enoyl-CoA hydratase
MLSDLGTGFDRTEADGVMIVLRSGRPGIFSAGFELNIFAANDAEGSLKMVKTGAELAFGLLAYPLLTIGLMEGHAFPMGMFLLLACDVRIGTRGGHRIGLNEVAIGIAPPRFAIELARSRVHPAWLSRTVTLTVRPCFESSGSCFGFSRRRRRPTRKCRPSPKVRESLVIWR